MLAPIILFVYNRPEHTRTTLKALADNYLASESKLYIFSDSPKNAAAEESVFLVREIIKNINGFASVQIVEREKNFGLARSVISGVTEIINIYDRAIILEDDLITSHNFLKYMNNALDYYKNDSKAFSIGGYQFPEQTMSIPDDYRYDTYASYRCCSWGWATWRDRWCRIDWSMAYFDEFIANPARQKKFNRGGQDMTQMLIDQKQGKIDSWAIRFCYAHFDNDMHCIYPVKTLVNNIGLDNTGVHCGIDPSRQHERLDKFFLPKKFCPAEQMNFVLTQSFYRAFCFQEVGNSSWVHTILRKSYNLAYITLQKSYRLLKKLCCIIGLQSEKVNILIINTFQKDGGAARAAWRTYLGVREVYPNTQYLTLIKEDLSPGILGRYKWSLKGLMAARFTAFDRLPMIWYPKRKASTFTAASWINPLRIPVTRFKANLVHLHWIASSLIRIEDLKKIKVPVVWTLHDTWAFTGGCHYTGDCSGFRNQCGHCPQLNSKRDKDLSRSILYRKQKTYANMNLTIVAPSQWLADLAQQSSLFSKRRIEVIPNGLDTDIYRPMNKQSAKEFLGIDSSQPVLLFGAQWLTDQRKGGDLLITALEQIDFACTLLTFGEGQLSLEQNPFLTVRSLGKLSDDYSLALMYSAADVFVCPSREDNLPNTVAEALACGTPCVAFNVNGLPDMITHQVNGWLARPFVPNDLLAGINWLIKHPHPELLRQAARSKAVSEYSLRVMASRYAALYAELSGESIQ